MARESSPPAGVVTLDVDAEIAALEAASDRDRQAIAGLQAQIKGREENITFLRGIRSRVTGGTIMVSVPDAHMPSETSLHLKVNTTKKASGPKLTQKFRALSAMADANDEGLMAIEMINISKERFPGAKEIERTSLSPLLAKMASLKDGPSLVIHHKDENRWSITAAGREELKRLKGDN